MTQLFENNDFILYSTGHDYDFVGIIETKGDDPLTFFFSEELFPATDEDEDWDESCINEDETKLIEVRYDVKDYDEADEIGMDLCAGSYFITRDDKSTGFLSDPEERGQFLAIIKAYCPEKLKEISWA